MCRLMGIEKTRTTAYRPSANGQVERFNRTLMDAVRCYVGKNNLKWDKFLPQIAGALRASVNRHTGFTPNRMMLGRETIIPAELIFPVGEYSDRERSPETYVNELEINSREAFRVAREVLGTAQRVMKKDYDLRVLKRTFVVGECVYVLQAAVKGRSKKLAPKWKGPGVVMKKLTPYLYKVKLRGSVNTFNPDRIKKCVLKVTPPWVEQAREEATNEGNEGAPHTEVYCICGGPDDRGLMIQCDQCQDWFHGKCVSVNEQQAREIMTYHCPVCEASRVTG